MNKKITLGLVSVLTLFIIMTIAGVTASGNVMDIFGDNTNVFAPGPLDADSAESLRDYISDFSCNEEGCILENETIIFGEMEAVKTSSQPLYLDDVMSSTKQVFTESQLPIVLASGEINGKSGKDYEYDLKIEIPNSVVKYGETSDNLDTPIIFADFDGGESYKLKVIFPTAVDVEDLAGESINLFGKEYSFTENEDDLSNEKLVLLDSSTSVFIDEGETKTIEGYEVFAYWIGNNNVILSVNGELTNTLSEGESHRISGDNYLVVKKNLYISKSNSLSKVEVTIGSGKLVLENNQEVELRDKFLDGTNVIIKPSGEKIREIEITVTPGDFDNEIEYLKIEDSLTDPIFKTISFMLDSVTPDLESEDRDYIRVKTSGDEDVVIEFTNKAGEEYNFEFINDKDLNFLMSDISEDEYFITRSNDYTQIWKVEDIEDDEIRVRDQGSGSDILDLTVTDESADLPLADGDIATITLNKDNSINVSDVVDYVFTEKGAKIEFNGSWINITEDTKYNGGDFTDNQDVDLGENIYISISYGDDIKLSLENSGYTEDDIKYVLTRYGSYIEEKDDERVEIYYPEEAMAINFYIGEIESQITTEEILTEGKVSEVVVGGSAINPRAASLLGGSYHGEEFTNVTGVGVGQAMIKIFADKSDENKVVVLVAGYEVEDTARAVEWLKTNDLDLTVDNKIFV